MAPRGWSYYAGCNDRSPGTASRDVDRETVWPRRCHLESISLVTTRRTGNHPQGHVGGLLWIALFDAVHHRGQLSAYIRPMGGKVPSIYGPSADSAARP